MWLLLPTAAAEPFEVRGGLFDSDTLQIGADGTVHALVSPKDTRLSKLTNQIAFTNDQGEVIGRVGGDPVRYVRLPVGGEPEVTVVPGPSGQWAEDQQVENAALVVPADGVPVVLITGQVCGSQGCTEQAWISRLEDGAFRTRDWDRGPGARRGLVTAVTPDGWWAVSHVSGGPEGFTGFEVIDARGNARPWIASERGFPEAVVDPGGTARLLFKVGKELHLSDGTTDTLLADGASDHADAVAAPDGVHWLMYDAEKKRLRGGLGDGGTAEIDGPESGWHHALTVADGHALAAWYYYRNNYNKGVRVGAWAGDHWDTWTQLRSDTENLGWGVDVAASADRIALIGLDRSRQRVVVNTWPDLGAMRAEALPDAGNWTDRRRNVFFFAYGGGWYQFWNIRAAAPDAETFSFDGVEPVVGEYGVQPGLGLEGGFAGKIGRFDLALEYLRRSSDREGVQTIQRLQNVVGKLGIDDLPLPDSELQLHFRASDLDGAYAAATGDERPFTTDERLLELRYVGKQGYHFGLRYHGFAGPLDVFESADHVVTDTFVADARFTTASVVGGWAVMDYLKKYEVRFLGPYFDAQGGVGYANAALLDPAGRPDSHAGGLTFTVNGDLGLAAYQRVQSAGGLGGFVRVGGRGWYQYTGNTEPEETAGTTSTTATTGTAEPRTFRNFSRTDLRYGPYANVGLVF